MKKTYLLFGILIGLILTITPVISAVEYSAVRNYTIEELQSMDIQKLRDLVNEKLGEEEPTGLITIAINLLFTIAQSLFYIIPAFIYLLIRIII